MEIQKNNLDNTDHWIGMELVNSVVKSYFSLPNNQVRTRKYGLDYRIIILLIYSLGSLESICLILSIIALISFPGPTPFTLQLYATQLIVLQLTFLIKEIYFDQFKAQSDSKINNRTVKVYRDNEEIDEMKWSEVKQGDIVYLTHGEVAPADILLLDSQQIEHRDAITYVDTRNVNGEFKPERKKASYLTQRVNRGSLQKRNWEHYQKVITGKLRFQKPSGKLNQFTGYLKLTKDPKLEKLSIDNLILRNSSIETSLWVYGLVIYAGMDCKIEKHINSRANKQFPFLDRIHYLFKISLLISVLLGLFSSLIYLLISKQTDIPEVINYHFLMFSIMLPHMLYVAIYLFLIFVAMTKKVAGTIICNYMAIINLGSLDFVILPNSGVITTGQVILEEIVTSSAIYDIKGEECPVRKIGRKDRRHGSSVRSDSFNTDNKNIPFMSIQNQLILVHDQQETEQIFEIDDSRMSSILHPFTNVPLQKHNNVLAKIKTQIEPIKINRARLYNYVKQGENQSTEIIRAFGVCHRAEFFYNPQKDVYTGISSIKNQEVLLKLLGYVGWEIAPKLDGTKQLGLRIKQNTEKLGVNGLKLVTKVSNYEWVGINNFESQRDIFSVVVRYGDKYILYCKGKPQLMMNRLKLNRQSQKMIQNKIQAYKVKDMESLLYAKRELLNEEKEQYLNDYTSLKLSLTTTKEQIQQFSKSYQKNLQLICIVGLGHEMNQKSKEFIEFLTSSGIKICMVGKGRSDIGCFKSLLPNQSIVEYVYLDKSSSQLLKYYLNYITNEFKNKNKLKYAIIINGAAWDVILHNRDILNHFMLVLYYSEGLLAFEITPTQTEELAFQIKNNYPRHHSILGIGYSYCDLKFMDSVNVGVSLNNNLPTDIKCQNIQSMIELLELGPYLTETLYNIVHLIIYKIVIVSVINIVYEIILLVNKSSFTLNSHLVYIYLVYHSLIDIIFTILVNRKTYKLSRKAFYLNFRNYHNKLYLTLIEATIHGIIIIGCNLLCLPSVRLSGGGLLTLQAVHMSVFLLIVLVGIFRHLFNGKMSILMWLGMSLVTITLLVVCLVIVSSKQKQFSRFSLQFLILFSNFDSCVLIVNSTIFCIAATTFLQKVLQPHTLPQLSDKISINESNQSILDNMQPQIPIGKLVRHLFKEQQSVDSSITSLVCNQIDVNTLKISSMIQIRNKQLNIKYLFERSVQCISIFGINMGMYLALEIILIGVDIATDSFKSYLITLIINCIILTFVCLFLWKTQNIINYYQISEIVLGLCLILLFVYASVRGKDNHYYLLFCLMSVFTTQIVEVRFIIVLVMIGFIFCGNLLLLVISEKEMSVKISQIVITFLICLVNLLCLARSSISQRTNFIMKQNFQKETIHVNDVLSILVPKFVKDYLESNDQNSTFEQEQNKVAILFCYVCNFDQIVRQQGRNVVLLMDQLFRQFDQLCHNFAVQKIETVGMTYMAATGIKDYEDQIENEMTRKNKVDRLLKMGILMLQKANSISWGQKKNKRLKIKIGIHAGDVIVGVIGYHKPQFSLIGDTVNTTSRHCTTASPGQIVLSQAAIKQMKKFSISSFKKDHKEMKGLGNVSIYRYLKNQVSQSKQHKIRARFICLVDKVIKQLKQKNAIKYRRVRASQFAQNAMIQHRMSTKKLTLNNSPRRSSVKIIEEQIQEIQNKNHKYTEEFILKYNNLLEPKESSQPLSKYLLKKYANSDQLLLVLLTLTFILDCIIHIATTPYTPITILLRCIAIVFLLIILTFYNKSLHKNIFLWLSILANIYTILILKIECRIVSQLFQHHYLVIGYSMLCITILSSLCLTRFIHILAIGLSTLILTIIIQILRGSFDVQFIYQLFYILGILLRKFIIIKDSYKNYSQMMVYEKRSIEQQALVSQLLPKHAYEKLKNQNIENKLELTDKFDNVTMLFADIKGFTSFSNKNTPSDVVKMLRELFQQFDKSCLKHNVYKVYTIGDCYVVLGFTDCYKRNILEEAKNVVNMGLSMVQTIQKVRERINFPQLDMRIGIHTGTIIGGIIGTEIVRYDVYGSDVMIANKFQEYGQTGHIHISQSTKQILEQDKKKSFNIVPKGTVKIQKLNVEINGYILTKKKFQL